MGQAAHFGPNPAQQKVGLGRHDPITLAGRVDIAQGRVGPKKTTHRAIDLAHHAIVLASRVGPSCLSVMLFHRADLLGPLDRKSTRLNSSHLVISYAVFCLKKKTNKGN